MRILFFILFLMPFWALGQPSSCDTLFQRYNPIHVTTKTSTSIINELKACVILDNTSGLYQATGRGMDNTILNPDKSIITQSESTRGFTIQSLFDAIEESRIERNGIIDSYNNIRTYNTEQGGLLSQFTKLGCMAFGGKNCAQYTKIAVAGGIDLLNYAHTADEREDLQFEFANLHKTLLKYGVDTRRCGQDESCIIKEASPYLQQMTDHEKRVFAKYYDPKTASSLAEGLANEEIDEAAFSKKLQAKIKKLTAKTDTLQQNILAANNVVSKELAELAEGLSNFQNLVNEGMEYTKRQLEILSKNDSVVISELVKHQVLIEQNAMDIAIIQDILIGNLDNNQKLELYNNCLDGKEGCPSNLLKAINGSDSIRNNIEKKAAELKKIKSASDFIRATEQISQGLEIGYELALTLGLKGEAAVKTGEVLKYVGAALQVGKGVAQIYSGDGQAISGVLTAVQAITNLFGREAPPEPIVVLRQEMHERFDIIDQKLNSIIELQLAMHQNLAENIEASRVLMHKEFNNIKYILKDVIDNQGRIESQLKFLLDKDFNSCFPIIDAIYEDSTLRNLNYYNNYIEIYEKPGCETCLQAIRSRLTAGDGNFVINKDDGDELNLSIFSVTSTEKTKAEMNAFKEATTFFDWYYGKRQNKLHYATQQLLLPIRTIDENQILYCEDSLNLDLQLNPNNVLNPTYFLDVISFRKLVNIYNIFYPFFEIYNAKSGVSSYSPLSIKEFIALSSKELSVIESNTFASNKRTIDNDIRVLSEVSNIMLAQQALMSGHLMIQPLYYILYQDQYLYNDQPEPELEYIDGVPVKQFAINLLKNNPVLAQNFAKFVIRKNYRLDESIYKDKTILDSLPVNKNFHRFENFAYEGTHPKVYIPGVDSFYVDTMVTYDIDTRILEQSSYIDKLDFEKFEDYGLVYLKISEPTDSGENVEVYIPIPDIGLVLSNTVSFNYAFQYTTKTSQLIDGLSTDILLTNGLRDNWLELSQFKLTILNSLKEQ